MKPLVLALLALLVLTACRTDDSQRSYGGAERIWTLKLLDGVPFPAQATLTFPKSGEIAGEGPCNRYFGAQKASYPAFSAGPIGSTRMACPEMAAETAFLAALEAANRAQSDDETLVLSSTGGLEMVFKATD